MRFATLCGLLLATSLAAACDHPRSATCRDCAPQREALTAPAEARTEAEAKAAIKSAPRREFLIQESPEIVEVPRRRLAIIEDEPQYYRLPARQLLVVDEEPAADVSARAEVRSSSSNVQALRLKSKSTTCRQGPLARLREALAENRENRQTLRTTRQALRSNGSTAISIAKSKG